MTREMRKVWNMVKNQKQAMEICRSLCSRESDTPEEIRDGLIRSLINKSGVPESGNLMFTIEHSREVEVRYLDTGLIERFETIEQPAIIGQMIFQKGNLLVRRTAYQVWVGRVFPQWRVK
ncbi:MAG: hypothetical protein WDZ51_06220 [Pirellulaceae bacterium]